MLPSLAPHPDAAAQLDLERRLREVPSTAAVRGVFFTLVTDHLNRVGKEALARKVASNRWVHVLYPVGEFLEASAIAASHVHPDAKIAMSEIWSGAANHVVSSWFGRVMRRVLRPDPESALRWIENSREHQCNYGRWRVEHVAPRHVVVHMFDEYIWIDSAHKGGCEGLLKLCGVEGTVTATTDGLFQGRLEIRWSQQRMS